jgi:hypothetical protein
MHHFLRKYKTFATLPSLKHKNIHVFSLIFVTIFLAACGSTAVSTPVVKATTPPTAIATPAQNPTPTPVPTQQPKATHEPTRAPAKSQPTQPAAPPPVKQPPVVPAAPAVLDLQPASMSIVGHLDCKKTPNFTCFARVLSGPGNQSVLNWNAFTNVPGGIIFRPSSGVLTPGQSVLITIIVPSNACTPGLFFFRGPINTHTITWAC